MDDMCLDGDLVFLSRKRSGQRVRHCTHFGVVMVL